MSENFLFTNKSSLLLINGITSNKHTLRQIKGRTISLFAEYKATFLHIKKNLFKHLKYMNRPQIQTV